MKLRKVFQELIKPQSDDERYRVAYDFVKSCDPEDLTEYLNVKDDNGLTIIAHAILNGWDNIVRLLLTYMPNVSCLLDDNETNALLRLAKNNEVNTFSQLNTIDMVINAHPKPAIPKAVIVRIIILLMEKIGQVNAESFFLYEEVLDLLLNFRKNAEEAHLLTSLCITNLQNDPSNKQFNTIFDYLIERDSLKKVKQKTREEALKYYFEKQRKMILAFISNNNLNELTELIQLKKKHNQHESSYFKKVINETHMSGITAMDIALAQNNKMLVGLLIECNFDNHLKINHKNNTINILRKLIMAKVDYKNIDLIKVVFKSAKNISNDFIREVIRFCFKFRKIENNSFYDAVLDCITALPQKSLELTEFIFFIHIRRIDVTNFIAFADKYPASQIAQYNPEESMRFLQNLMENPIFGNRSSITYLIQKNAHAMLDALLPYHPTLGIKGSDMDSFPLLALVQDVAVNKDCKDAE
ncbi:MAG: hypothetical protein HKM04_08375 [Legionellales bacterium]|nr:hypothetical protein [Legionellales bacterium]